MNVIFFDIDGTLVDTGGAGGAAMVETLANDFNATPRTGSVSFAGRTDRAIVSDMFELHDIDNTRANWDRFNEVFPSRLEEHLPRRKGHVLPGVVELLTTLAAQDDVTCGLLTGNLREGARLKLAHYGLYDFFSASNDLSAIGGFGDVHHDRDLVAQDALASAEVSLGRSLDMEKVWVVGDTPRDIQCARAIRARVVAVATGTYPLTELSDHEPDVLREDLADVESLVRQLGI